MSDRPRAAMVGGLGETLRRIDQRLRELNTSERAAALAAGLSPGQIRTMRRQYAEGRQQAASIRTISGLAQALQTTPEWLLSGAGQEECANSRDARDGRSVSNIRHAGTVAGGVWLESESSGDQSAVVQVPPDPRYPAECQSAYEVRGTSANRLAQPGEFLIVVDRSKMGLPLRSGDLVIVTSYKKRLREVTVRRYKFGAQGHRFYFESNDPRYNVEVELPSIEGNDSFHLGGVAVGVYRPLS
jgi:SOS-response transcriptional repressor LexA